MDAYRSKSKLDPNLFSPEERRAKRDLLRQDLPKPPGSGQPIDWSKLDQTGKPQITFSPGSSERARMVALLTTEVRSLTEPERRLRRSMETKLQSEFTRIYERYRKAELRARSRNTVSYGVMPAERKYALKAAVACIAKEVTPRQVLEYWHEHIADFADAKMPVPPLTFLSQPANIDSVAIGAMASKHGGGRSAKARGKDKQPSRHTMSDTTLLHPGLRRALMEQGFDLSEINDTYLTSVQAYAIDIVTGFTKARFIPSKLRAMVKWAADHFYKDVNVDDYI